MSLVHETHLRIYLNDHLAGSAAGLDLARRCHRSNREGTLGEFLARLVAEIETDGQALRRLMTGLGLPENPVKVTVLRALERLGRLKPNGQLRGYSDLSRLAELEGLCLGVEGKLALWRNLETAGVAASGLDLREQAARAERQREELERHRLEAARQALSSG